MTEATQLNPAVEQQLQIAPALVEAVREDPELLTQVTRAQLAVVQDRLVKKVLSDPDASVAQLAAVHERLAKGAKTETKEQGGPKTASVVINFIRGGGREGVTIEGTATAVSDGSTTD